jgi:hypothetical protein
MWYLYLDESGDLGFDFINKKPSSFFTICILATSSRESFLQIGRSVRKTLSRKLGKPKKQKTFELKGTATTLDIKKYFWRQVSDCQFGLYAITLNKRRVYNELSKNKERVYNFVARQVIDKIPFEKADNRVQIVVDKCKARPEILDFNNYIFRQLEGRINPSIPVNINHSSSHEDAVLQAVDLFAWGIFRKYERSDREWFDIFRGKMLFDGKYL